jgi:fatty-acid desaturase
MSVTSNSDKVVLGRLERPAAAKGQRVNWYYLATIAAYHLLACLAFLPWFFSWTGVVLLVLTIYVFGTLGINLCYHRLLTHRGFVCTPWVERTFAIFGMCCLQNSPIHWVAIHRRHHQYSDEQADPHTPLVSFLWSHVGWLLVENRDLDRLGLFSKYARDIAQDRFYARFERLQWYLGVVVGSWLLFYFGGMFAGLATGSTLAEATQFGLSLLIWGVFLRTVVVWHITWSVNSVTHVWGSQRYETHDGSRNNFLVGYLSNGEGWHNNHHADQRTAKNSRRWWEFDVTYLTIRLLAALGLAKDVVMPNPRVPELASGRARPVSDRPAADTAA